MTSFQKGIYEMYEFLKKRVFSNDVMFGKSVIFPLVALMNLTGVPPLLALVPPEI